jgi:hypothetical protein
MKKIILFSLLSIAVYNTSIGQTAGVVVSDAPGWHRIADRHAGYKTDRDEIMVVGNRFFKQIKLKVKDAPLNLISFEVYYKNGSKKTIEVNKMMNAGDETAAADIDNTSPVTKVILVYNTVGSKTNDVTTETKVNRPDEKETEKEHEKETEKERAEVEVWGLK